MNWKGKVENALKQAVSEIGLQPGDANVLLLTNAGYGQIMDQSTEGFLDAAHEITGCSTGARNLLAVHSSVLDPLWFSLYSKDTGAMVFAKWTGADFERQAVDGSPDTILTAEGWGNAQKGLIGPHLFGVASISLTWAANPPWPLLQAALFHDHFCPGVNAGYIGGRYMMEKHPLGQGEKYVFVTAPAICPADALQVMFNTTSGKSGGFSMAMDGKTLKKYSSGGVRAMTVAMRVNPKKDECIGTVLGFDWGKANQVTGVKPDELAPKGGKSDPMFWVARAKMSRELVRLPKEKLLDLIVEMKTFNGPADMASQIGAGDPYAAAFK